MLLIVSTITSCKKTKLTGDNSNYIGTWRWYAGWSDNSNTNYKLELKEKGFIFQDIKTEKITAEQLEEMKNAVGSYEALFSRIARKYKELRLGGKCLTESDYKNYILQEYTFLKRPAIFIGNKLFVGNTKAVIAAAQTKLENMK